MNGAYRSTDRLPCDSRVRVGALVLSAPEREKNIVTSSKALVPSSFLLLLVRHLLLLARHLLLISLHSSDHSAEPIAVDHSPPVLQTRG